MRNWRWAVLLVVACGLLTGCADKRPKERVQPPPEMNPDAVVWRTRYPPKHPQAGDVWVKRKDGAEMVYVPAGEFVMGSAYTQTDIAALLGGEPPVSVSVFRGGPREQLGAFWEIEFAPEQPQFRAQVPAYWIDKREVTVAQYREFCQATGRQMPPAAPGQLDDGPITQVTWEEAAAYADWAGKRLPTEMEWEKAARGTDARTYPWGNEWGAHGKAITWPTVRIAGIDRADSSPYGVLDMAGNAVEWCADWFDPEAYDRYAKGDLATPNSGWEKVVRGASWSLEFRIVGRDERFHGLAYRCTCRSHAVPDDRVVKGPGFRCARDAVS